MPRAKRQRESQAPSAAEHQLDRVSPTAVGETKNRRLSRGSRQSNRPDAEGAPSYDSKLSGS